MLKIEANPKRVFLLLAYGPLLAAVSLILLSGCIFLLAYDETRMQAAFLLVVSLFYFCQGLYGAWKDILRVGVTRALVANSRTLAIIPFNAPVRYLKRNNCQAALGHGLLTVDDRLQGFAGLEFKGRQLRELFLLPLYTGWCTSHTSGEIERHLTPWAARQIIPLLLALPLTLSLVIIGLTLTEWNVTVVMSLASIPLLAAALSMWRAERKERSRPKAPERLYITHRDEAALETARLGAEYAKD